jgi:hypothetical protein
MERFEPIPATVNFWEDGLGHHYNDQHSRTHKTAFRKGSRWGNEMKFIYLEWLKPIQVPTGQLKPFMGRKELDELLVTNHRSRRAQKR